MYKTCSLRALRQAVSISKALSFLASFSMTIINFPDFFCLQQTTGKLSAVKMTASNGE